MFTAFSMVWWKWIFSVMCFLVWGYFLCFYGIIIILLSLFLTITSVVFFWCCWFLCWYFCNCFTAVYDSSYVHIYLWCFYCFCCCRYLYVFCFWLFLCVYLGVSTKCFLVSHLSDFTLFTTSYVFWRTWCLHVWYFCVCVCVFVVILLCRVR